VAEKLAARFSGLNGPALIRHRDLAGKPRD
jgi:hypothetical protein